jgi:hypothetical protein
LHGGLEVTARVGRPALARQQRAQTVVPGRLRSVSVDRTLKLGDRLGDPTFVGEDSR